MEPKCSLPQSQVPTTYSYPELGCTKNISPGPFRNMIHFYGEELFATRSTPKLEDLPCRLSATAYWIYSHLTSILEVFPPSATWGPAIPLWQGPTYRRQEVTVLRVSVKSDSVLWSLTYAHSILTGKVKYILVLKCQQILSDDEINRETVSTANRILSAHAHNMLTAAGDEM